MNIRIIAIALFGTLMCNNATLRASLSLDTKPLEAGGKALIQGIEDSGKALIQELTTKINFYHNRIPSILGTYILGIMAGDFIYKGYNQILDSRIEEDSIQPKLRWNGICQIAAGLACVYGSYKAWTWK